jgi:hypothetical protein
LILKQAGERSKGAKVTEKVLRLISLLALICLVIWVGASALGKQDQVQLKPTSCGRRRNRKSIVWNQSPVQAPSASAGLLFSGTAVI